MFASWYFWLTIVTAAVFYLLLPGIGAFVVWKRWYDYRFSLLQAMSFPRLTKDALHKQSHCLGNYCSIGRVEALQEEHTILVVTEGISVGIQLSKATIYIFYDVTNRSHLVSWKEVTALVQGTSIVVAGAVSLQNGLALYNHTDTQPLFCMLFDCKVQNVFQRSITAGRQRNEYWNIMTPFSLIGGGLVEILIAVISMNISSSAAIFAAAFAVLPFLHLLPPGIFGIYMFRRLRFMAQKLRKIRDYIQIPHSVNDLAGRQKYIRLPQNGENDNEGGTDAPQNYTDFIQTLPAFLRTNSSEVWQAHDRADSFLPPLTIPVLHDTQMQKLYRRRLIYDVFAVLCMAAGISITGYLAILLIVLVIF